MGHVSGFVALAKEQNPKIEVSHCMIHRQALVVKQLEPELEAFMIDVIKIVNAVKGHALNTRLFRDLYVPEEPEGLAEALLELRSNSEARMEFQNKADLSSFWMSKAAKAFKIAHLEATKMLLPFATTYLCEQGFFYPCELENKV
ncbi:SCAN domain-containing protein 3-like [Homarus americanus]|uniref:SCAN domain-containing protein 3-like n=1 Tax=Homarus americanus TaxID=6706 RepID=UPI001C492829|nr:SCAN domain-containing protein 3-like [Homarus americanus]